MKKIIILSAAVLGFNLAANAQMATSSANQNVALSLSNAIAITFVSSGTAVSIPFTTVANYTNGVTSAAQALTVQSNLPFNVTVNANAANFTYSGSTSPAPTMPVSGVLALEVTANTTGGTIASGFSSAYGNLTSTAQSLITNGNNGGAQNFSVQYQATPGFTYPAGTYTANVVYTVTQI